MIDLLALGIATIIGVPCGVYADKRLKQITKDYKARTELKKFLTNHFDNLVKFGRVYGGSWGYWCEAKTNTELFDLQIKAKQINCKFKQNEHHGLILVHEEPIKCRGYEYIDLPATQLLLGYSEDNYITVDMINCPHLLVTGLSGQGKTGMLKVLLNNLKGADIVLLNGFDDDFKEFRYLRKIRGEKDILLFLTSIYENLYKRERPVYLVIEELATIKDKKLNDIIKELLCVARHYNIFIIGIIQIATKEELKFKSYFNARCSFKQLDDSAYRVALGCGVEEGLSKREFYLFTDGLYKGMTFTL